MTSSFIVTNARFLRADGSYADGSLVVRDGRIAEATHPILMAGAFLD